MEEPHYRVVHVKCFGDPDGLEVVDAGLPTAGRDEVRVRVSNRSAMVRHLPGW
jgi:NADPH2:quinone reductase